MSSRMAPPVLVTTWYVSCMDWEVRSVTVCAQRVSVHDADLAAQCSDKGIEAGHVRRSRSVWRGWLVWLRGNVLVMGGSCAWLVWVCVVHGCISRWHQRWSSDPRGQLRVARVIRALTHAHPTNQNTELRRFFRRTYAQTQGRTKNWLTTRKWWEFNDDFQTELSASLLEWCRLETQLEVIKRRRRGRH